MVYPLLILMALNNGGPPRFCRAPRLMRGFGTQARSYNVIARSLPAMPTAGEPEGRERRGNRSKAELDEVNLFIFRNSDCHIPIVIGIRNDINATFWIVSGGGVSSLYVPATEGSGICRSLTVISFFIYLEPGLSFIFRIFRVFPFQVLFLQDLPADNKSDPQCGRHHCDRASHENRESDDPKDKSQVHGIPYL